MEPIARAWVDAWNAHDIDAIVAWYDATGTHRMASGSTYAGNDAIRAMVERSLGAYPDLAFTVRDGFATSTHFAIEYTMRGTQQAAIGDRAATGRSIVVDGALVGTTTAAGRVVTCVDYLDHHDIRRQLGLAPES